MTDASLCVSSLSHSGGVRPLDGDATVAAWDFESTPHRISKIRSTLSLLKFLLHTIMLKMLA